MYSRSCRLGSPIYKLAWFLKCVLPSFAVKHFDIVTKRKDYDIFQKLSKKTIVELCIKGAGFARRFNQGSQKLQENHDT